MKAVKIYFLCYLLKVVVAVPDFGNLPSFDDLLRKSIIDDQDICSNVTSYACISRERNGVISKKNYLNIAQSFIRKTAIDILKLHSEFEKIFTFLPEEVRTESSSDLDRESTWFSACMGQDESAENSLHTLKTTMEQAGSLQDIENNDDSMPWESVAQIYAKNFGFSPFFEVILYGDNSIAITRPNSMKIKSYSKNALHSIIEKFFSEFSNGIFASVIRNSLHAAANAFSILLNGRTVEFQLMNAEEFSEVIDDATDNVFDWFGHFEDIGFKVNAYDHFYFDTDYFVNLGSLLVALSNNCAIANLIHFLYAMNTKVFSTWYNGESALINKYTEEECFKQMPIKSGVISKIISNHLPSKFSLIQKILENIIGEYKKEIDNSWLNDDEKEVFLNPLENLKLKITNLELTSPHRIDNSFPVVMNGLKNIINFEKSQMKFKLHIYKKARKENIIHVNRNEKDGEHLVPYVNYNVQDNLLEIPLEELILPLFDPELTIAWNYAYFGVAISRELFKLNEIFHSVKAKHSEPFNSKMNCFKVLQYSVKENVNFYDLINSCVGLKIAYKAFKQEIDVIEHKLHRILGLQYTTPEQQFFLAYSAIYCEETNPQTVGISASNLGSFGKAFYCKMNSQMNPMRKCDFWAKPINYANV
ncbi:membrane metallo-endopeptidase-like 1 [Leptopilina heterotoma]|uniref:membrane metallo-endopeptidase-like 1 n=1 Tax=Leptopilina heterotoma TaxID=63436 RepID=UPI001CA7E7E1|nr:membrane metallo-endopeptidase-like 1 [Leptopilina heterotoma]